MPFGEAFVESVPLFSLDDEPPDVTDMLFRRFCLSGVFSFESCVDWGGVWSIFRDRRIEGDIAGARNEKVARVNSCGVHIVFGVIYALILK